MRRCWSFTSRETLECAAETFARDLADFSLLSSEAEQQLNLRIHQIEPFQLFSAGPYSVTAFPANHAPGMGAMLYAIEADRQAVFYGTDTAGLPEQDWHLFEERNMRFDIVILDHTYGPEQMGSDHLCAHEVIQHVNRMQAHGFLRRGGRVFATHIAHEGNPVHQELEAFARKQRYEVAYDGLVLTI